MAHAQTASTFANQSQNIFSQPLCIFGVPVDRETIFADSRGIYQKRVEKRQRRMIVKTTFIKFFLHQGERLRCLTTGYTPVSIIEQLLTGAASLFFKRVFIVFTDQRILVVPSRFNHSAPSAISQICYADCAAIQMSGRALVVQYKNGQREKFPYVGRKEKKKIRSLIQFLPSSPKESGRLQARTWLCPSCTSELDEGARLCGKCKLQFKSNQQAKIRALMIPGGGYFYSRFPVPGVVVGLIESGLAAWLVYQCMALRNGLPVRLGLLPLLGTLLIAEKWIVAFHSQRLIGNQIPEERDFALRKL